MQVVLTRKNSEEWLTVEAPVHSYDALVVLVTRIYREARRPTSLRGLVHKLGATVQPGTRPRATITFEDFEAVISGTGHSEVKVRRYDGKPTINAIPYNIPGMPKFATGFTPKT